jgi:hypothetical protein
VPLKGEGAVRVPTLSSHTPLFPLPQSVCRGVSSGDRFTTNVL